MADRLDKEPQITAEKKIDLRRLQISQTERDALAQPSGELYADPELVIADEHNVHMAESEKKKELPKDFWDGFFTLVDSLSQILKKMRGRMVSEHATFDQKTTALEGIIEDLNRDIDDWSEDIHDSIEDYKGYADEFILLLDLTRRIGGVLQREIWREANRQSKGQTLSEKTLDDINKLDILWEQDMIVLLQTLRQSKNALIALTAYWTQFERMHTAVGIPSDISYARRSGIMATGGIIQILRSQGYQVYFANPEQDAIGKMDLMVSDGKQLVGVQAKSDQKRFARGLDADLVTDDFCDRKLESWDARERREGRSAKRLQLFLSDYLTKSKERGISTMPPERAIWLHVRGTNEDAAEILDGSFIDPHTGAINLDLLPEPDRLRLVQTLEEALGKGDKRNGGQEGETS